MKLHLLQTLKNILRNTFSIYSFKYRIGAVVITAFWSWYWTGSLLEGMEITVSVMITKQFWYGYLHRNDKR